MALLRGYRNGQKGSLRGRYEAKKSPFRHDLFIMSLGFALALVFSIILFEILNFQYRWTSGGVHPAPLAAPELHGAAPQNTQESLSSILTLSPEKVGPFSAVPGEPDVYLLRFTLSPSNNGFVHGLTFVLDNLAHPYDLKTLKLFLGDKQLGEVSFFEGKGSFQNLMLKLEANKLVKLSVVGTVSGQAPVGDRIRLKLAEDGIDAIDDDGNMFEIVGGDSLKGAAISVVRGRSK